MQRRNGWKILSKLFLIDGVAPLAQPLAIKHHVPALDLRPLQFAQLAKIAQLGIGHGAFHVVEKTDDGLRILYHPPLRHIVCEARNSVEAGDFLAQRDDLIEDLEIAWSSAIGIGDVVALARLFALRVHQKRYVIGIVEADDDVSFSVLLNAIEVRLRQATAFVRCEMQESFVFANVFCELLRQLGQPLGYSANS